jgi:hypothetical protein
VDGGNALGVVGTLRLVEHDQMLGRGGGTGAAIGLNITLNGLDKSLPAATTLFERVLEYFDQWSIARQVDRGSRGLPGTPIHGKIV